MHKARLLKLADFLATKVPSDHFNMMTYCTVNSMHPCQTTACAIGWCVATFPQLNLHLDYNHQYVKTAIDIKWDGKEFFALTNDEWQYLFSDADPFTDELRNKETPKQVAERIRDFVNNGMPEGEFWKDS